MNWADGILLAALLILAGLAVWRIRRKKKGGGCAGCSGCANKDACRKEKEPKE